MPGFNLNAAQGNQPNARAEPRRAHRWVMQAGFLAPGEQAYIKSASRPTVKMNPVEMHHDQETVYFAGKTKFEPINLEYYDIENTPDMSQKIYEWLVGKDGSVMSLLNTGSGFNANKSQNYKKTTIELAMTDANGEPTETWEYHNAWPESFEFGNLDYSEEKIMTIKITLRYDRAVRK